MQVRGCAGCLRLHPPAPRSSREEARCRGHTACAWGQPHLPHMVPQRLLPPVSTAPAAVSVAVHTQNVPHLNLCSTIYSTVYFKMLHSSLAPAVCQWPLRVARMQCVWVSGCGYGCKRVCVRACTHVRNCSCRHTHVHRQETLACVSACASTSSGADICKE